MGGGGGGLTICQCLRTHTRTHTKKIFVQTLPTLYRWIGEERRLLQVFLLDYHQTKTLKTQKNREKDKFALVTHTKPEHRRLALQNCYTHKMAELVRRRFTAYGGFFSECPRFICIELPHVRERVSTAIVRCRNSWLMSGFGEKRCI